jgi:oligogalacturonide lyase
VKKGLTRRTLLAFAPALLAAQVKRKPSRARPLPSVGEFVRFADPTTENMVVRLTNAATSSLLPAPENRFISLKERFLIFASDRSGSLSPFRLDLRTGALHQLTQTQHLSPTSLCLDAREKSLYFIDGGDLKELNLAHSSPETIADAVSSFSLGAAGNGLFVVRAGKLEYRSGARPPVSLAENVSAACLSRPDSGGCLFSRDAGGEREFWYALAPAANGQAKMIRLAAGRISNPFWAPDGQSIVFLRETSAGGRFLSEIHEVALETGVESLVTATSQFASFSPNFDGSVFVGASRSKAQPTIVLLLRSERREMTLCEHRSSQAASVSPVFSPDSRRVYFQSDHQGKPALYSVNVEQLVEPLLARSSVSAGLSES